MSGAFRSPPEESERLIFSLFDIKKRIEHLRDEVPTLQPGTAALTPGLDGRGGATDEPQGEGLYGGIESFLCDAVHIAQIADDMVFESMDQCDPDSLARLAFAVNHSRTLLDDLLRRYLKRDWSEPH